MPFIQQHPSAQSIAASRRIVGPTVWEVTPVPEGDESGLQLVDGSYLLMVDGSTIFLI